MFCVEFELTLSALHRLSGGINVRSIALVSNEELQKQMEVLCSQAPLLLTEASIIAKIYFKGSLFVLIFSYIYFYRLGNQDSNCKISLVTFFISIKH